MNHHIKDMSDLTPLVAQPQTTPVKKVDSTICDLDICAGQILNCEVNGGRFGRWTSRDYERLHEVLDVFRKAISQLMLPGYDVSETIHNAWMEARTIAPGAGYTGIQALKQILGEWMGNVYLAVDKPEWD